MKALVEDGTCLRLAEAAETVAEEVVVTGDMAAEEAVVAGQRWQDQCLCPRLGDPRSGQAA